MEQSSFHSSETQFTFIWLETSYFACLLKLPFLVFSYFYFISFLSEAINSHSFNIGTTTIWAVSGVINGTPFGFWPLTETF